jgi:hypothetical protein
MMRRSCALALLTALWLSLQLQGLGQVAEPTLEDNLNFIANTLNSRGNISWTEELPDLFGASYSITNSVSDVKTDATACSVSWTSVLTASNDKVVENYSLRLAMVSGVRVQPYSEYVQAQSVQTVTVSPETYIVLIKTDDPQARHREFYRNNKLKSEPTKPPDVQEARILLADEQAANRIADAIRRSSQLCAAK